MTPEQFEAIFESIKNTNGVGSALRNLVLKLAVSGQLTSQNEHDLASSYFEEIRSQRSQLINSRKIKKNKKLTDEQAVEIFEIPANWKWVKLGEISEYIQRGKSPKYSEQTLFPVISQKCVQWSGLDLTKAKYVDPDSLVKYEPERFLKNGDLLWNSTGTGTIGRLVQLTNVPDKLICDSHVTVVRSPWVETKYLLYFLKSPHVYGEIENDATGSTNQIELTAKLAVNQSIPLPPLEEQKRIVAKVDELMALCDELENAGHKRNLAKTNFNSSSNSHLCGGRAIQAETLKRSFELQVGNIEDLEKIRKTVFTLAIQGKLTTQSSSDEPALELLNRIDVEKAKDESSASRARKKDGNDYGFLKYEIPSNWAWTSLAQIGHISPKTEGDEAQQASFVEMASIFAEYGKSHLTETRIWAKIKKGYTRFREGDVGLAKITPCFENGKSAVFDSLVNGIGAGTTELLVVRPYLVETRYILTFLKSEFFIGNGIPLMTGTAGQKRVPSGYFANCPFPLPPLEEQKRIVGKVDELMALCDDVGASLSKEEAIKANLLKTLVA